MLIILESKRKEVNRHMRLRRELLSVWEGKHF